jgi:cellulose synthase/poly-beta-1,6-N-acetylglucosamine synthase-like glycosyltransferase
MWWLLIPVTIYSAGIFVFWLILVRKRGEMMQEAGSLPRVTVVVAVRNEERHISTLLDGLAAQDYPAELLEIIIVNDNSTDRTPVIVSEWKQGSGRSSPHIINLIYNLVAGKKQAIRTGIEKATGEVILTTDADCITGPGWVSTHASVYTCEDVDMVLGEVFQEPAGGFASQFGVFEFSALQAVTESAARAGHPVMCNAANMSFRKDVYLRHAGELRNDLPSGDDMFLLHAVSRGGGVIRYAGSEAAAVETAPAVTAAALLRQRARWASKTFHYRDAATITLAAATAACHAAVTAATITAVFAPAYLPLLAASYGIRLLPDYLITAHNLKKRGAKMPLLPFLISEIIYPLYFVTVAVISLFPSSRRFSPQ